MIKQPIATYDAEFAMRVHLLITTIALLLCVIVARAGEPIVIKDSEAIKYLGKEVEVRGRVVSVTTSPLGTTFISLEENTPIKRSLGLSRPGQKLRHTRDLP